MSDVRFSQLVGSRVVDSSGRHLGHVFDVPVRSQDGEIVVEHLLVGRAGLAARLSLDVSWRLRGEQVAWSRVLELGHKRILVRPGSP